MRLLHTETLKLHEYFGSSIPGYTILSHTWGNEEVTYSEWQSCLDTIKDKTGFLKVKKSCDKATKDGYIYLWVDTICIDKSSSAELSEAINSMFAWYAKSDICCVYLSDVSVTTVSEPFSSTLVINDLESSRWFTRGWTLQELLAPRFLVFLSREWRKIGEILKETSNVLNNSLQNTPHLAQIHRKYAFSSRISKITGISLEYLLDTEKYTKASVARRMFWASSRQTTRIEDIAYCLLGIFNINMPLLYGEGNKAFTRLQEEIMKVSTDQSIFVWNCTDLTMRQEGDISIIAPSPSAFSKSGNVISCPNITSSLTNSIFNLTNFGLSLRLPVFDSHILEGHYVICMLNCRLEQQDNDGRLYLPLRKTIDVANDVLYERCHRPSGLLPGSLRFDSTLLDELGPMITPPLQNIHVSRIRYDNRNSIWTDAHARVCQYIDHILGRYSIYFDQKRNFHTRFRVSQVREVQVPLDAKLVTSIFHLEAGFPRLDFNILQHLL